MRSLGADDPRRLGTYRVLALLGSGGMGRVYVGRSRTGRTVALKVVHPGYADDPGFRSRFRREVESARRVAGVWTAPVLDADTEGERPWLATGYVPGVSLHEAVATRGPLPEPAVRVLAGGLAAALTAIHEAGVVHRDLKPSNVMVSPDGPRVIDFGISRAMDATVLTGTDTILGSPGFLSPEQVRGEPIGPAADVFALGAVLAYAATGTGPFGDGNAQALLFRLIAQEPQLDDVPEALRPIVEACLAKDPADRPTPGEVRRAAVPDGDIDALLAAAWLPPEVANDVSRRAVALLELEHDAEDPGNAAETDTAYVGAPEPSEPSGPADAVPDWARDKVTAPGPDALPTQGRDAGSPRAAGPGPYDARPFGDPPRHPPGEGEQRDKPTWQRLVPYVTVLVIGGIAAGIYFATGDNGTDDGGSGASTPTPTAPATAAVTPVTGGGNGTPSPPPSTAPPGLPTGQGSLPAALVGTWTGTATTRDGVLKEQVTITVSAGKYGDVVASSTMSAYGIECKGNMKLTGVDGNAVKLTDVQGSGNAANPFCTSGGDITLSLRSDGKLQFTAVDVNTGNPTGPLDRTPG
ncbi:serine/threonine-protein kinase [Yinghuangia aomiensis]|uniref:Serine/threonine-protein kinase n=1 Tax=Yinghuangia aomiensis TaxID=676205 RepID=A0ABP9I3C0_9ACTN